MGFIMGTRHQHQPCETYESPETQMRSRRAEISLMFVSTVGDIIRRYVCVWVWDTGTIYLMDFDGNRAPRCVFMDCLCIIIKMLWST